jgi:hypothetical protein
MGISICPSQSSRGRGVVERRGGEDGRIIYGFGFDEIAIVGMIGCTLFSLLGGSD